MKKIFLAATILAAANAANADEYEGAMRAYFESDIKGWVGADEIVDAIRAQNAETEALSQDEIDALDARWRDEVGKDVTPTVTPVIDNALAAMLRDRVAASSGSVTEILIMDARGLNVAASATTSDYWQGDEAKYQETYLKGADAVHFGEVEFDESTQAYQGQISLPVVDSETGEPVGAITVAVNAASLF